MTRRDFNFIRTFGFEDASDFQTLDPDFDTPHRWEGLRRPSSEMHPTMAEEVPPWHERGT